MITPIPGYQPYLASPTRGRVTRRRKTPPIPHAAQNPYSLGLAYSRVSATRSRTSITPSVRYLTDSQLTSLLRMARRRPDLEWNPGRDIAKARNAHVTNTASEMASALTGEYDYLEGDVRVDNWGQPVMAHDRGAQKMMALDEWLAIGAATGRGLKLDFKESQALLPALAACKRHGVPGSKLIINVSVWGDPGTITPQQLRRVRRLYPDAILNLSLNAKTLDPRSIAILQQWARAAGGPIMFPLRMDMANEDVIRQLRPYGKVAIWNNPTVAAPKNTFEAIAHLRKMGVDGMIDLRKASLGDKVSAPLFDALVGAIGWGPAVTLVNSVGDFLRMLD